MSKPNETIYDVYGDEFTGKIPEDLKWIGGKASITTKRKCTRCGGNGRMPFSVWAGRCFRCGGSGVDPKPDKFRLFTLEALNKYREQKKKRDEKNAVLRAERQAEYEKKADIRQAEYEARRSERYGEKLLNKLKNELAESTDERWQAVLKNRIRILENKGVWEFDNQLVDADGNDVRAEIKYGKYGRFWVLSDGTFVSDRPKALERAGLKLGKVIRNAWVFSLDRPYIVESGNNYWTGENVM